MQTLPQIIQKCGPALVGACDQPFWVCVFDSGDCPGCALDNHTYDGPPNDFCLEVWAGGAFDSWYPPELPAAIMAVIPASALSLPAAAGPSPHYTPPPLRHGYRRGRMSNGPGRGTTTGNVICAVSEEGEAYAVVSSSAGRQAHGVPTRGRLLDLIRAKLFLPPGPSSVHDLEMASLQS
jgi:hypothetical protein